MKLNLLTWLAKQIAKEILMDPRAQQAMDAMDTAAKDAAIVIAKVGELKQMIEDLKAQDSPVTSADLDALAAKASELAVADTAVEQAIA